MATPIGNSVDLTGYALVDGLIQGGAWTWGPSEPRTMTYSLHDTTEASWSAAGREAVAFVFAAVEHYIDVSFQETSDGDIAIFLTGNALSRTYDDPGLMGMAVPPDPARANVMLAGVGLTRASVPDPEGDVFLDSSDFVFQYIGPGEKGLTVALHELGHALGLKHPHDGGANSRPLLPVAFDDARYTVMSYDINNGPYTRGNLATPGILDVVALQVIYGPNRTAALGDNNYVLGRYDANITIWDAGGNDTIDASAELLGVEIDLREGELSEDWSGSSLFGVAIGAKIENAIGGSGSDVLIGNDLANVLDGWGGFDTMYGNAGNDSMRGLDGSDLLYGGDGNDDVNGNVGIDTVWGGPGNDTVRGGQNSDVVYGDDGNDPHVNGNIGFDTVYGGAGDDGLFGGQDADALYGGSGNDTLSGDLGSDTLTGGAGADRFVVTAGQDTVADFAFAEGDRIAVGASGYTLGSSAAGAVVTVAGVGSLVLSGVAASTVAPGWFV